MDRSIPIRRRTTDLELGTRHRRRPGRSPGEAHGGPGPRSPPASAPASREEARVVHPHGHRSAVRWRPPAAPGPPAGGAGVCWPPRGGAGGAGGPVGGPRGVIGPRGRGGDRGGRQPARRPGRRLRHGDRAGRPPTPRHPDHLRGAELGRDRRRVCSSPPVTPLAFGARPACSAPSTATRRAGVGRRRRGLPVLELLARRIEVDLRHRPAPASYRPTDGGVEGWHFVQPAPGPAPSHPARRRPVPARPRRPHHGTRRPTTPVAEPAAGPAAPTIAGHPVEPPSPDRRVDDQPAPTTSAGADPTSTSATDDRRPGRRRPPVGGGRRPSRPAAALPGLGSDLGPAGRRDRPSPRCWWPSSSPALIVGRPWSSGVDWPDVGRVGPDRSHRRPAAPARPTGVAGRAPGLGPAPRHPASWRSLHPGAWWLWAGGLALAAMRTTNLFLLGLIIAVVARGGVGPAHPTRRGPGRSASSCAWPCSSSCSAWLQQILIGAAAARHRRCSRCRRSALPSWMAGMSLGGPVTVEALVDVVPARPAAGHGADLLRRGQQPVQPVPDAPGAAGRALRGRRGGDRRADVRPARRSSSSDGCARPGGCAAGRSAGVAALRGLALPVLEGRSRPLGGAGRVDGRPRLRAPASGVAPRPAATGTAATVVGLLAVAVGLYGLADAGAPGALGLPAGRRSGAAVLAVGLFAGGRRAVRTRYRPDPWRWPEWLVSASGLVALARMMVAGPAARRAAAALNPRPRRWPGRRVPGGRRGRDPGRRWCRRWPRPAPTWPVAP